jgi:hypothetical protein
MDVAQAKRETWRNVLPVCEAAVFFPQLPPDQLQALADDIYKNGLKTPISLWAERPGRGAKFYLLDGRNRLDAMEMAGLLTVKNGALTGWNGLVWKEYYGEEEETSLDPMSGRETKSVRKCDPWAFVISANIRRRQLKAEEMKALMERILKERPELTNRQMSKVVQLSDKTIAKYRPPVPVAETPQLGPITRGMLGDRAAVLQDAIKDNPTSSNAEIGKLAGVSKSAVQRNRKRLGLTKPKTSSKPRRPQNRKPKPKPPYVENKSVRSMKNVWLKLKASDQKYLLKFFRANRSK